MYLTTTSSVFLAIIILVFLTDVYIVPKIVGGLKTRSLLAKKPQECTDKELKSMKEEEVNEVLQIRSSWDLFPSITSTCFELSWNRWINSDLFRVLLSIRFYEAPLLTFFMLFFVFFLLQAVNRKLTEKIHYGLNSVFKKRDQFFENHFRKGAMFSVYLSLKVVYWSTINWLTHYFCQLFGKEMWAFIILVVGYSPIIFHMYNTSVCTAWLAFLVTLYLQLTLAEIRLTFFSKIFHDPELVDQHLKNLTRISHPLLGLLPSRFTPDTVNLTLNGI